MQHPSAAKIWGRSNARPPPPSPSPRCFLGRPPPHPSKNTPEHAAAFLQRVCNMQAQRARRTLRRELLRAFGSASSPVAVRARRFLGRSSTLVGSSRGGGGRRESTPLQRQPCPRYPAVLAQRSAERVKRVRSDVWPRIKQGRGNFNRMRYSDASAEPADSPQRACPWLFCLSSS